MAGVRKMPDSDPFLHQRVDYRVQRLISEYLQSHQSDPIPIDIAEVARIAGVTSIREVQMIPEAALAVTANGFEIILQKNFKDAPGARRRQRFSVGHEIGHTFFYERREGALKPRTDAPTGDRLESACHQAARSLLVPETFLRAAIRELAGFPTAAHLLQLATRFDVSAEVMVRRVHAMLPGLFESSQRVPFLVRGPNELLEFAVRPNWLRPVLNAPTHGIEFGAWFRPGKSDTFSRITIPEYAEEDEYLEAKATRLLTIIRPGYGTIRALRFEAGPSLGLYEISAELSSALE